MRPVLLFVIAGALVLVSPGAVLAEKSVRSRAQPAASSYKFEDLTITQQVATDGKPNAGFVSYFRLIEHCPLLRGESSKGKKKAARACSPRTSRSTASMKKAPRKQWATTRAGTATQKRSKCTRTNISLASGNL
jgi:hypothetical protein